MIGKKVRVFWPVDMQWYIGTIQDYDPHTDEHLLVYPDGDTEWIQVTDREASGQQIPAERAQAYAEDAHHAAGKRKASEMVMRQVRAVVLFFVGPA